MSLIVKLLVSLVIGAAAFMLTTVTTLAGPALLALFCAATVATALLVSLTARAPGQGAAQQTPARRQAPVAEQDSSREQGQVKWFNISKGFGFITKDDGEEIFVHFRSIRGEGRRGLRDGQRVSFVVAQSDKGPQAEDVEGID
jgi:CspA family cold shock protein